MNRISRLLLFAFLLPLENGCMDSELHPIKDPVPDGTPAIQVDPASVDFGIVPMGEISASVITMSSVGTIALNVTAMQVGEGRETFTLLEPLVGTYEPGDSVELTITYNSDGSETSGVLQILSNDPSHPNTSVPLLAHAETHVDTGETGDTALPLSQPVAVCSVDPVEVEAIHGSADWIGNSSYDSDGTIVEYRWNLVSSPA
jgi:hypothetical protein